MIEKSPVLEAKRYVENARTILREKAIKENHRYTDRKYVKLAGHAAYTGVLVALDGFLGVTTKKRRDVNWYKEQLASIDKKCWQILWTHTTSCIYLWDIMGYRTPSWRRKAFNAPMKSSNGSSSAPLLANFHMADR